MIVKSATETSVYGVMNCVIEINGGTYQATQKGFVINMQGKELTIKNAVIEVSSASVMHSIGIQSSASKTYLENVTVNANYSKAVDLKNAYDESVIKGGTFITEHEADKEFQSPTISYQGTLTISDASITRIGVGILFARPRLTPTEVENLTINDCTFNVIGENNQFADVDFKR